LAVFRIEYHLARPKTAAKARAKHIFLQQRFSDHAPLLIDYDFML
jgi:exodeoxyribonuclease III